MKTKVLIGILVFLILVNLATIGTYLYLGATRPDPSPPPPERALGSGTGADPMARLDDDQRRRLNELMRSFHEETRVLHDRVRDLEERTFQLLHREPVPTDSVDAMLRQMGDIRLEISRAAARRLIDAKSFLSTEQQDVLFDAIMKARPGGGGPPAGRGPLGGPPRGMRPGGPGGPPPRGDGPPPEERP